MASLDQFLQDLDDLDDDEPVEEEPNGEADDDGEDGDVDMEGDDTGELRAATGLLTSAKMSALMGRIDAAIGAAPSTAAAAADGTDEYAMIVQCNEMVIEVDGEIEAIAKSVRDTYARRFPELESLIPNPLDYARVVLKAGTETDLTQVDLTGILPSASIMVVTVTASTTAGQPLPEPLQREVSDQCEQILGLSDNKGKMLAFVESRMGVVAPNLSALVGTTVGAKLVGAAGGLPKLADLPSTVLQILGSKKRNLQGGSVAGAQAAASVVAHAGFIGQADLVQNTPPALRMKAARILAGKCTLAARIDAYQNAGDGNAAAGQQWRDEITKKITKLLEPPPHKVAKALPVPPEASGKRRGGRRIRKMKERLGQSQKTALMNRVQFGVEEDTTSDGLLGVGMLTKGQQNGKVRVSSKEQKLLAEKNKKARTGASSGASNGLASSLAFTPVQGIELVNPSANRDSSEGTETYFSKQAAFFAGGDAAKS